MLISPHIHDIAALVKQQGIIAYPTEAVFGLGCDPQCDASIQRILTIKQRPAHKGLILIAASLEQLYPYIQPLTDEMQQRIQARYDHPVTWLVPAHKNTSSLLTGEHTTLAIRVTQHPSCVSLCDTLGHPLISTSANPARLAPAMTIKQLTTYFSTSSSDGSNHLLDGILDASLGEANAPSQIRDGLTNKRLR